MTKRLLVALFCLLLAGFGAGAGLEIHHLYVGQGDGTLIVSPTGLTVLIDAGNTGYGSGTVLPYLDGLGIVTLDLVVASHYHADHIGGLDEVINGLGAADIGLAYDRGLGAPLPTTVAYTDYASAAAAAGRVAIGLGQVLDLGGGVSLTCLASDGSVWNYGEVPDADSSENDLSIAFLLSFERFQYFTGGDCGGESSSYADLETPLAPLVGDVDACKVNHHGSAYSTNQLFVDTLLPEAGFISVGNNSYGHPVQAVLDRLAAAGCWIYQTGAGSGGTIPADSGSVANGHLVLETTGFSYSVSFGETEHLYPCDDLDAGDLDASGTVGPLDLVILLQHLAGNLEAGTLPFLAYQDGADFNGDELVDGTDALALAGWLAGM